MEYAKHGTCEKCGGPLRPKYSDEWDCPACSATFRKRYGTRLLKAVSWGGVIALALFIAAYWISPGDMPLSFFGGAWVVATIIILTPGDHR